MIEQPQPTIPDFSNPVYVGPPPGLAPEDPQGQPVLEPEAVPSPVLADKPATNGERELASNQVMLKRRQIVTIRETNGADDTDLELALTAAGYTIAGVGAAEYGNMLALCAITDIDEAVMQIPSTTEQFHEREDMFLSSDIARIVDVYNRVNLEFDRSKIDVKERTCLTHLGKKVVIMETTGGHDRRVAQALTDAGYNVQGVNTMGFIRMRALCAIDSVDGKPYTRPRTKTDLRERAASFLSKEIQMIMALYQEVNMIGATF